MAAILPTFPEFGIKIGGIEAGGVFLSVMAPFGPLYFRRGTPRPASCTESIIAIAQPRLKFEGFAGGVGVDLAGVEAGEDVTDLVEVRAMQFTEVGVQELAIGRDDHREGHRVKL